MSVETIECRGVVMPIEWLGLAKFAQSALIGGKSLYDRAAGKQPHLNFEPGDDGVKLRVLNPRTETIIIEAIEALPPVLGFSAGDRLEDVVRAVVAQRQIPHEHALAVVPTSAQVAISVITFDPFGTSSPELVIKVRLHWRSATRGMFSKSNITRKISVRDIRDLQRAVEVGQPRITII